MDRGLLRSGNFLSITERPIVKRRVIDRMERHRQSREPNRQQTVTEDKERERRAGHGHSLPCDDTHQHLRDSRDAPRGH